MMELNETILTAIADANPGDFAVYQVRGEKMLLLHRGAGLPALSGMTAEEYDALTREDAAAIVLESDRPHVARLLGKLLQTGRDTEFSYRILHRVKGAVWVHARARLLGLWQGCPVLMVSFFDISAEAEEHERLLDDAASIIYVVDKTSHEILYANVPAMQQWGKQDYCGKICYEWILGRTAPCPWCTINRLQNGAAHDDASYSPPQDSWFRVDCREMNWHGRQAVANFVTDVTREKERQEHLELDKTSLETIVNNIPVGVGVCEVKNGQIRTATVNAQLTRLLGISAENFISSEGAQDIRIYPDDRALVQCALRRAAETGSRERFDCRFRPQDDGPYRWYRAETSTLEQGDTRMVFLCVSDVDEEKAAQAEIQRSRRLYETAVEEAQLVVWEYDIPGRRIEMAASPYARSDYEKYGIPRVSENAPQSLLPYLEEKDAGAFLAMCRAVESGAPRASCDVWYKPRPGLESRCEHLCCLTVFDEKGQPVRACGFGQDITSRKLEEQKYAAAFRRLSDAHPYTLASFHLNLTQNWCGEGRGSFPGALNRQKTDTVDGCFEAFSALLQESRKKEFLETFRREKLIRAFQKGQTRFSLEYSLREEDGSLHWHRGLLFLLQNPSSGDVEGLAYALDITDQRKNEEVIEHLTSKKFDFVALVDLARHSLEFRNRRPGLPADLPSQLGYEDWQAYVRGRWVPEEEGEQYQKGTSLSTVSRELSLREEYTCAFTVRENGRLTRRQVQYSWLNRPQGLVLMVRTDVTDAYEQEQKQLEIIREALHRAEEANRAKTEFVSRISHDIRTPISIIQSMTRFAFEDLEQHDKLVDDLRKIEASGTFLLSLISDVLDISKIDSGKIELQPEPYLYSDYLSNIRNMFEPLCRQKGVRFVLEEHPAAGALIMDHIRLNQITLNLLSNAVKYTPAGGTVSFSAQSRQVAPGRLCCELRVRDTGIGMSREFQKKMFEPFSQEYDNPGRPKAGSGTGLGLSIVKRLVDLIGGTIAVSSTLGAGTEVRVRFEAPEADAATALARQDLGPASPPFPLSGRVLLAEDNEINTAIAVRILEGFGLTVDTAENGRVAVERFARSSEGGYQAILMDLQMPLTDGYEAAQQIRALARPDAARVPIIAMTADAFSAAMERSRRAGMNDYVTKPLDPAVLRGVLQKAGLTGGRP